MANYYDGILGGIGTLLVAGAVIAVLTHPAVIIAFALVAAALIGHALFRSPLAELSTDAQTEKQTSTTAPAAD